MGSELGNEEMTMIAFKCADRVHIFDRQDVQDDLLAQFNAAEFFLKKHLNRRSVIKGMNREDIYEIPLEAIREAVVNAIVHRDYSMRGTSLMVEVYDDRIEITNPGGIPRGSTRRISAGFRCGATSASPIFSTGWAKGSEPAPASNG